MIIIKQQMLDVYASTSNFFHIDVAKLDISVKPW